MIFFIRHIKLCPNNTIVLRFSTNIKQTVKFFHESKTYKLIFFNFGDKICLKYQLSLKRMSVNCISREALSLS